MKHKTIFSILYTLVLASNCIVAMNIPTHPQTAADWGRLAQEARDHAHAAATEWSRQQYWMTLATQYNQIAMELRLQELEMRTTQS